MGQDVYIDLYFLINTSMDLLSLMIAAALLHRKVGRLRAILAAAFGGLYAVASLFLVQNGFWGFAADCLAALLICLIAFGRAQKKSKIQKLLSLLKIAAVYVLVSMILGGIMTALYAALNRLQLPFESLQGEGLSVWSFAILTAAAGLMTAKGGRFLGLSHKTKTVTVDAVLFGQPVRLCAMVDTGNLLRDPISGKSVILANLPLVAHTLPEPLKKACEKGCYGEYLASSDVCKRTRPICAHTAGGATLLIAIIPDRLTLTTDKESYEADYLIAPSDLGERAQGFDAIIAAD